MNSQSINFVKEIIGADKETSKIKKINLIKSRYPDSKIFYIGDTKGDIVEGKKAGVKTVAVTWGWHTRKKLKEGNPDYIARSPEGLLNLLRSLN